ncbi:MAG TPA: alpha-glucosidase family protein [Azospirillaceae bacterium]|nr:alpha-glucosidase family protein [Azospirillaceae bacterium]
MSRDASWLQGAVLYQIYPLSFLDRNGDGLGDLDGVLAGLDHVASLGVDALWISPFYPSPLKDFGYDVSDHQDVDPRLGTLETFDRLLEAAHARGLKVLVDLVCGHTSDEHAWFQASRRSRHGGHADWYVWADPSPDGTPPNNWLSVFGGSAWSWEPRRHQYYLHHFLPAQPTLNLRSEAVGQALLDIAAFWLERGVDGFRIDAVDFLYRDPHLRSNPPRPYIGAPPLKPFALQEHLFDMMHPDIDSFLDRLRAVADRYGDRVLLGELSSQPGAHARIGRYTRPGRLHAAYTLDLAKKPFTAASFRAVLEGAKGAPGTCWSFSNHDVERATSRWRPPGADTARFDALLAVLLSCMPGTICVYQGEELGLPQADLDRRHLRDPFGIAYWPEFKGRDGSRTPIPWRGDAPHAGFTDSGQPWLPVPDVHRFRAVDRQEGNAASPLMVWRECLALRHRSPALSMGSVGRVIDQGPVLAFERSTGEDTVLAVFNLSDRTIRFDLPAGGRLSPLAVPAASGEVVGDGLTLPPFGVFLAGVEAALEPA